MNDYIDLEEEADIDEEDLSDIEKATAAASKDPGMFEFFLFSNLI